MICTSPLRCASISREKVGPIWTAAMTSWRSMRSCSVFSSLVRASRRKVGAPSMRWTSSYPHLPLSRLRMAMSAFFTSSVAAKEKTKSCRIGGTMITIRPLGSRNIARSSLMIRARMRSHMSGEPLSGAARREAEEDRAGEEKYGDVLQEERPDVAGEEHRLQAGDQIARRNNGADPLDDGRHRADLEQEAR